MSGAGFSIPAPRPGGWMATYGRGRFYPLDPQPSDFCITDIAHALALCNRFGGHTPWPYSVAQHSVLVAERIAELRRPVAEQLHGLMHDASEAYICDVPRPTKAVLTNYKELEWGVQQAIFRRFKMDPVVPAVVGQADEELLATEARDLMGITDASWGLSVAPLPGLYVQPWNWQRSEDRFLDLFAELAGSY